MGLGFLFTAPVDPKNPLESSDPPPKGWDTDIDTQDYRRALFGFPGGFFIECHEWEKRELQRHHTMKGGH